MEAERAGFGPAFERARVSVERGRRVRIGAVLQPAGALRRCQLFEIPRREATGGVVRVRVRGSAMSDDGVRDGDYLVLDARAEALGPGRTVLADVDGCAVVRRVARTGAGVLLLEPPERACLPFARRRPGRVHGAVVGILRKRGFERTAPVSAADLADQEEPAPATAGDDRRLRALEESLRAVSATYDTTQHPRLRRALRDEAALLGREIARERARRAGRAVSN